MKAFNILVLPHLVWYQWSQKNNGHISLVQSMEKEQLVSIKSRPESMAERVMDFSQESQLQIRTMRSSNGLELNWAGIHTLLIRQQKLGKLVMCGK